MYGKNDFSKINDIILKNLSGIDSIILFGSYVNQEANDESDIDIAIITESDFPRQDKLKLLNKLLMQLAQSGYDVDVIIKSKSDYLESLSLLGTLSYEISTKGVELWKKNK
jgi:predicted nucleotidyltransferase